MYRFCNKIKALQMKIQGNPFLDSLMVNTSKNGNMYISFPLTAQLEPYEVDKFKKGFNDLRELDLNIDDSVALKEALEKGKPLPFTSLQKDLVKYLLINSGLTFRADSYGPVMDPAAFVPVSYTIDMKFNNMITSIQAGGKDLERISRTLRHFAVSVAPSMAANARNIKSSLVLKDPDSGNKRTITRVGDEVTVVADLTIAPEDINEAITEKEIKDKKTKEIEEEMADITENEDENSDNSKTKAEERAKLLEKFYESEGYEIIYSYGTAYKRLAPKFALQKTSLGVPYTIIGQAPKYGNSFLFDKNILEFGWREEQAFPSTMQVRVKKDLDKTKPQEIITWQDKAKTDIMQPGDQIAFRKSHDFARSMLYLYEVISVDSTKKYKLKFLSKNPTIPVVDRNTNAESHQDAELLEEALKCIK